MPVVYIDVVWLVNFAMDAVLLGCSAWISRRPLRLWRVLGGAVLGSMYAVLLFFPPLAPLTTWPGKAIASLAMVAAAIPCRSWLELLRVAVTFYFVSFVFAGAAIALHFAVPGTTLAGGVVAGNRLAFATSLQSLALLVAIPLVLAMLRYVTYRLRESARQAGGLYPARLVFAEHVIELVGLVDTGNHLRDPVTRKPVCLVDARVLASVLPDALRQAVERDADLLAALEQVDDPGWYGRFALVPFRGAGGAQQMAVAVRPDRIEFGRGGTWRPGADCLVALYPGELSSEHEFQAILHTAVITEADGFEELPTASKDSTRMADAAAIVVDSDSSHPGRRL
jgi:stage II sporulation protein GA (sporulation sigma-E factor processing peptidase)